ncbi:lytic transglycosylase domain-containing protein [Actinoplanes sp. NPDC051470]|uniref:aggregation-promoting factor C-terminal-like domain-containing protein n=1 Tax=unclassified Actinoplanes TaxID=2626549 RepID=UPI00341E3860
MNRLWSRVGVRVISVGLLVLGIVGGVYFGQNRVTQQQGSKARLVVQATVDEEHLLKQRQSQHAAARAWQRQAESDAAAKAAAEAKIAAGKARTLEKKAIDKKAADKKADEEKAAEKESSSSGGSGKEVPFTGDIPASCDEFSGNRAIGCALMLDKGFKIDQFPCLNKLWQKESGWSVKAYNSSSGATGIPQALPGNKMASEGADWKTNAATQIKWGLGYIKGRWNTPCGAWSHSQSAGWY